jgi:polygalacturonase
MGAIAGSAFASRMAGAQANPWDRLPDLLARVKAPAFPARDFNVTDFGAKAGGETDCTDAFAKAIAGCTASGGGRVIVPPGVYRTGAIQLKSGVNLHLTAGATIRFSQNPRDYLPLVFTRWEGMECMNYSPFIYAFEQHDIAVTGAGTLDGNCDCDHWWPWKGRTNCGWKKGDANQQAARDKLQAMVEKDVPVAERVFGEGSYLRPSFVQPYRCTGVLIEGVTIVNSPMYEVHPVLCRNVTVRNLTIRSHGPNNDGCDPESCTDVLIEGCMFDTGDDCIAIKSGRNRDGRRVNVPSDNIVIRNCQMKDGHGGVTLGSECSGGIRNVFAYGCQMDSPNLEQVLRIKTNSVRGGIIENIYMREVEVGQVSKAVMEIDFQYEEGDAGAFPPTVREVEVSRLRVRKAGMALSLRGYATAPIRGIRLIDWDVDQAGKPSVIQHVEGLERTRVRVNGKAE